MALRDIKRSVQISFIPNADPFGISFQSCFSWLAFASLIHSFRITLHHWSRCEKIVWIPVPSRNEKEGEACGWRPSERSCHRGVEHLKAGEWFPVHSSAPALMFTFLEKLTEWFCIYPIANHVASWQLSQYCCRSLVQDRGGVLIGEGFWGVWGLSWEGSPGIRNRKFNSK